MESTIPLDLVLENALDEALGMIDERAWRVPLAIVREIRREARFSPDGWARLSPDEIAKRARVSRRYCRDLLGSGKGQGALWRVHFVLMRGRVPKGGPVGTEFRLNPRVTTWRALPWKVPDTERRLRLELALRAPERRAEGSRRSLARRFSYDDRDPEGLLLADLARAVATLSVQLSGSGGSSQAGNRRASARRGGSEGRDRKRKSAGSETSGSRRPPEDRRAEGASTQPPSTTEGVSEERARGLSSERAPTEIDITRVRQWITRRTGRSVGGRLRPALARLVEDHGADEVLAALEFAGDGMLPPMLIDTYLPDFFAGVRPERPGGWPDNPEDRDRKLAQLDQVIELYESDGSEVPQDLLDERSRWENGADVEQREQA